MMDSLDIIRENTQAKPLNNSNNQNDEDSFLHYLKDEKNTVPVDKDKSLKITTEVVSDKETMTNIDVAKTLLITPSVEVELSSSANLLEEGNTVIDSGDIAVIFSIDSSLNSIEKLTYTESVDATGFSLLNDKDAELILEGLSLQHQANELTITTQLNEQQVELVLLTSIATGKLSSSAKKNVMNAMTSVISNTASQVNNEFLPSYSISKIHNTSNQNHRTPLIGQFTNAGIVDFMLDKIQESVKKQTVAFRGIDKKLKETIEPSFLLINSHSEETRMIIRDYFSQSNSSIIAIKEMIENLFPKNANIKVQFNGRTLDMRD